MQIITLQLIILIHFQVRKTTETRYVLGEEKITNPEVLSFCNFPIHLVIICIHPSQAPFGIRTRKEEEKQTIRLSFYSAHIMMLNGSEFISSLFKQQLFNSFL